MFIRNRVLAAAVLIASAAAVTLGSAPRSTGLRIDAGILADSLYTEAHIGEMVPPDFNPHWRPERPEEIVLDPGQDFGFIGFTSTVWNPPDPDLAVGPNHIVHAVNMDVRFFTKDGTMTFEQPLTGANGVWGDEGARNFVFDPVELFDPFSHRFLLVTTEHVGTADFVLLAVSDDDDPNGTWHTYRWRTDNVCGGIDFPNLGVGPDAIYISTDCFSSPRGTRVHIIDKSMVLDDLWTIPNSVLINSSRLSLGEIKSYDADQPAQYFASATPSFTSIRLHAISDPLGAATLDTFDLSVPTFSNPPGAQQLGSSNRVSTIDRRIKNGVYRNGSLWLSHTIGDAGVARTRWYEIEMNGWPTSGPSTPTLRQFGTVNLGSGVHNWFADIDVDSEGNAAMAFNRSSASEFVGVARTYRLADDPPGRFRPDTLQQQSTSSELGGRWGDYGGIHQDPSQFNVYWNAHEYRTTSWRTWIARFEIPGLLPCPEDLDGNGDVGFSDLLLVLKNWGPCEGECPQDIDGNGDVGFSDVVAVLAAWGGCP